MWKFYNFSITQILREINFRESRSATKTACFAIFRGSEFCQFGEFQPSKSAKIHIPISKFRAFEYAKNGRFCTSRIPNIDFT